MAERVAAQQPPRRKDRSFEHAIAIDRLHRVLRAGRVVLAAPRERGRDPALVRADRPDRQKPSRKRSVPQPRPSTSSESAERIPLRPSRSARSRAIGARDDDVVGARGQPRGLVPERLAQHRVDAVAVDGATDAARDGQAKPGAVEPRPVLPMRERVEDEETIALRATLPIDALELRAARQPAASGSALAP